MEEILNHYLGQFFELDELKPMNQCVEVEFLDGDKSIHRLRTPKDNGTETSDSATHLDLDLAAR